MMTGQEFRDVAKKATIELVTIRPYEYDKAKEEGVFANCRNCGEEAEALLRCKIEWLRSVGE